MPAYFELTALPTKSASRFLIQGQALCIRKVGDRTLSHILQRLRGSILLINGREIINKLTTDAHGNIQLTFGCTANQSFVGGSKGFGKDRLDITTFTL
jgi:hypothetical protein